MSAKKLKNNYNVEVVEENLDCASQRFPVSLKEGMNIGKALLHNPACWKQYSQLVIHVDDNMNVVVPDRAAFELFLENQSSGPFTIKYIQEADSITAYTCVKRIADPRAVYPNPIMCRNMQKRLVKLEDANSSPRAVAVPVSTCSVSQATNPAGFDELIAKERQMQALFLGLPRRSFATQHTRRRHRHSLQTRFMLVLRSRPCMCSTTI